MVSRNSYLIDIETSSEILTQTLNYTLDYGVTFSILTNKINQTGREDEEGKNEANTDDKEDRFALGGLITENFISTRPVEFNSGLSTFNPWGQKIKNIVNLSPVSVNPNVNYQVATFDSCISRNGDAGICASRAVCSLFGGRSSGVCNLGLTCCVSKTS